MTLEELKKVKFHFVSHLSMEKEHRTTYADESGRLGFCDITKKKKNGFLFGNSRRSCIWYDTFGEFVRALEKFELQKEGE